MEDNKPKRNPVWEEANAYNRLGYDGRTFAPRVGQYPSAGWISVQTRVDTHALNRVAVASSSSRTIPGSYDTQQDANSAAPAQIPPHMHYLRDPIPASLEDPEIRKTFIDRLWSMPAAEPSFLLRRATHKTRTPSRSTPSQNSSGSSPSTQTSGGVPVVNVLYPVRQPRGPRDPAQDIGFDWAGHARLNGRPNKLSSQQESVAVNESFAINNSTDPQISRLPSVQTQRSSPLISGHQIMAETPWFSPSWIEESTPRVFTSVDRLQTLTSAPSSAPVQLVQTGASLVQPNSQRQLVPADRGHSAPSRFQMSASSEYQSAKGASFSQHSSSSAPRPYIPSTMVLQQAGLIIRDPARLAPNTSYQGDAFSKPYLDQVENLPDSENCSLWIKYIPDGTPHSAFFDNIYCGAVWSLYLNSCTANHDTMGATLVFMKPESAAIVIKRFKTHGIQIGGNWLDIRYNKHGKRAQYGTETRVLRIDGPPDMMTWAFWHSYFKTACVFQLDRYLYLPSPYSGQNRMEFRFARVDGQAQSCRQKIERDEYMKSKGVMVQYGPDPCGQVFGQLGLP
ncbi:uncharacterized protein PAC_12206 [Phialocephala subalpina]|uniref:RRM domain-containing protein n=1 Tax=Phialocephala subalpina TaxID=576137 RepID=A0A1L7XBB1_9HELO|nr:uncharacterized protein PAC_12206 [Phialocephala subalpina]